MMIKILTIANKGWAQIRGGQWQFRHGNLYFLNNKQTKKNRNLDFDSLPLELKEFQ